MSKPLVVQQYVHPGFDIDAWAEIELRLGRTMEEIKSPVTITPKGVFAGVEVELQIVDLSDPWTRIAELKEKFGDAPFLFWVIEDELHQDCLKSLEKGKTNEAVAPTLEP